MTQKPTAPARLRRPPTHPGAILRDDVLPALELSVSEAARQLRVTRQTLHRVLAGKSGVSPEMAVRSWKPAGTVPPACAAGAEASAARQARANENQYRLNLPIKPPANLS